MKKEAQTHTTSLHRIYLKANSKIKALHTKLKKKAICTIIKPQQKITKKKKGNE